MTKFFNTAGPCRADEHYMLPPERRLSEVRPLIERKAFFVVHAPRQTGKTTSLLSLARSLTQEGRYAALHVSCKPAARSDDSDRGIETLLQAIRDEAQFQLPNTLVPQIEEGSSNIVAEFRLRHVLSQWSESCPRPVVLFLDEFDALSGKTLLSVLDQLHSGYTARPAPFPHSVALIGLRDVRDYRVGNDERLGTSSPFNIKLGSLRLRDFTPDEVKELYIQHEEETGQAFTEDAIERAFELTLGQPWLVNALASQAISEEALEGTEVTAEHIESAKEALILRRDTHIDSLIDRLREKRVRRVIEPIVAGHLPTDDVLDDDVQFVKDLGLVRKGAMGLEIANPIYHEVVPRALSSVTEDFIPVARDPYISSDGRLLFSKMIEGFALFWRQHAEHFLKRQPYSEAAAQLVFMAYLQHIVNGGSPAGPATIDREYAVGSGRIDLCIRWPLASNRSERFAIELKVWRKGSSDPRDVGIEQLCGYLTRLDLESGTLIIFDQRDSSITPEPSGPETIEKDGRRVDIWRL